MLSILNTMKNELIKIKRDFKKKNISILSDCFVPTRNSASGMIYNLSKSLIKDGVFVTCNRYSKGPFSFLALLNWNKSKSKILQKLAEITPTIELKEDDITDGNAKSAVEPQLNRDQIIQTIMELNNLFCRVKIQLCLC